MIFIKSEAKGSDDRERIHVLMEEDPDQPLHEKLDLMLPWILQNFAISQNGIFRTKATQIPLPFLSKAQQERWTSVAQIARPSVPEIGRPRTAPSLKAAAQASIGAARMAKALSAFGK